jgi:hypothetical protein
MVHHSLRIIDSKPFYSQMDSVLLSGSEQLTSANSLVCITTDQPHTWMSQMPREREDWKAVVSVAPIVDAMSSWASASLIRQLSACGSLQSQDFPPCILDCTQDDRPGRQECLPEVLTIFTQMIMQGQHPHLLL